VTALVAEIERLTGDTEGLRKAVAPLLDSVRRVEAH
jgi:hypothetical protein